MPDPRRNGAAEAEWPVGTAAALDCTASLRAAVWVLRLHKAGGYGAPYVGSATVLDRGDTAEIVGLTVQGDYTRGHRAAVFKALLTVGYRWAEWDRRTAGGLRRIRKRL